MTILAKTRNQPSRSSWTAEFAAWFRALESSYPKERRLFEDPFAVKLIRPPLQAAAFLARIPIVGRIVPMLLDHFGPGARTSGVTRTRLIDDHLTHALEQGITQVVILGSGFDSRAYRIPHIRKVRVFEVDQSHTLSTKQRKLVRLIGQLPAGVTFVAADLNVQQLEQTLTKAGFDRSRPAFFIWEGVTQYLTEQAVDRTLRFISSTAPGSFLLFTYVHRHAIKQLASEAETRRIYWLLERVGEPWTFGMVPEELPAYLEARGLSLVEDVNSITYRRRYLNPQGAHMKGYPFYRAVLAQVKQPDAGPQIRFFRTYFT
ncbi:class I SAM-dependent methyltransferase [Laceyella putida]|uniref:S-adenosyl-L-methionine-dependent methyltransferase n=1 Tax=Laceyella putida TaxID=110101 RepID=A0ABW2RFS2_9BACL